MKISTLNNLRNHKRMLPIAAAFMMSPVLLFAQTKEQLIEMRKETNLKDLNTLKKGLQKSTMTTQQLKTQAKTLGIPFSGVSDTGQAFQLKGFDNDGKPVYYVTYNTDAAIGTSTNKINSTGGIFNLDGENMIAYEWDGGKVLTTHQEFENRVKQMDNPSANSAHATHVAGTIVGAGINEKVKGMAPKAMLNAYDWNDDESEMIEAAKNGVLVSNHSYGYSGGFAMANFSGIRGWHWLGDDDDTEFRNYGKYTKNDQNWDLITANAPYYLPVKAAGNPRGGGPEAGGVHYVRVKDDTTSSGFRWVRSTKVRQKNGGELGFDCIVQGALGKNILTVGAANKILGGYKTASDVKMASFSAYGPVDDGRIKPDISGVGVDLFSTNSTGTKNYTSMSGTSMASPNVTGSLLLLQEHYKNENAGKFMLAATLKALAIGTAQQAGDTVGPDYSSGWGLLNAFKAASAISTNGIYSLIQENKLNNKETQTIKVTASGNEPLVVTIAWTDPAPSTSQLPSYDLNDRKAVLVNDLDIKVSDGSSTFLPWKLDPANPQNPATQGDNIVDNVEQVYIPNPIAGKEYTIEISHKGNLKQNKLTDNEVDLVDADSQNYSVVVTGINQGVDTDLEISDLNIAEQPINFSTSTPVNFKITNKGQKEVNAAKVIFKLINTDENKVEQTSEINLPSIAPNASYDGNIKVDLSKAFVNYKIQVESVLDTDKVKINNKSEISAYGILSDLTSTSAVYDFGFESDLQKNGWTTQDINNDNSTWQKINSPGLSNSGSHLAANFPNNKAGSNDWLFSNPLKLKGNQPYRLSLYVSKFQNPEERLKIFLANQANSNATLTPLGTEIIAEADLEYHKYHYEFSVPNDQIAYIAFQNKTPNPTDQTYAIGIDDVHIQNPNAKPEVDFKADKVITNTFDAVAFKGNVLASASNPATYKWSFTPNSISYLNGTDQNSLNPVVKFNEEGTYSISLVATNSSGEVTSTKNNYIKVQNVNAKASFSNRNTTIYQKETIAFANTSTGNPRPSEFLWEITPNDGIEFISETNKNSENPVVKFNKEGVYSVSLKVTSGLNSDTYTRDSLITVNPTYLPVRDVKYELDNATGLVKLNWQKPVLSPIFYEDLDGVKREVYGNNANNDSFAWHLSNTGYNNTNALRSWSWQVQPLNADDWAVTSKIPAGAELLSFLVRHSEAERYDVYVVPATDTGKNPSLEELKNGNKVYTFEAESAQKDFVKKEIDIRNFTNKDFHIAFHHRTKKEDNGLAIIIDNIEVGFNNSLEQQSIGQQNIENIDFVGINKTEIVSSKEINNSTIKNLASDEEIEENGVLSLPRLTGYQVVRNSEVIKDITDVENKTYTDEIKSNGTYTYDVYAVYSDGDKSEKRTVTVEVVALSTDEVSADDRLKVYPNPSDGKFTIEAKFGVSKLDTQVYDMSGKLIFKKEYQGNKADLNLTQYPKGIYLLNVVDNNGQKQTLKLVIK